MDLTGKVALVTGGGTGVGNATAVLLAEKGCDVAVNYSRSESEAKATVEQIRSLGRKAIEIKADIADEEAVNAMFGKVDAEFGHIDILVNSAAITKFVPYDDLDGMTSEGWDQILAVNVKGTFFCCREAIKRMKKSGTGSVVSVSSISGLNGMGSSIAYAASKAAVVCMTRSLAISGAPEVSVNAVAPGVIETRWIEGWEEFTDRHKAATPLARHASPRDVAMSIYGLILNPFMTGQTVTVDGGRSLGAT